MSCNNNEQKSKKGMILRVSSYIMTTLLLLMITSSLLVERWGYYNKHFYQYLFIEVIAVVAIVILLAYCNRGITREVRVDWLAVAFCSGFAAYSLVADCLVDKSFRFSGAIISVVLFLLGYVWNGVTDKDCFIHSFERAIRWFILVLLILSILYPAQNGMPNRYSGPIDNPSVFALYLCSIWAVLLGSLENSILNKQRVVRITITVLEMMVALILLVMSQSLTPMLALAAVTFLWLFRIIARNKGIRYTMFLFLAIGVVMTVCLIGIVIYIRNLDVEGGSRLVQKLQSANASIFLSGRDYYWRRYLSKMNLFGHSKKPFLWDHRILPHNALIGMMYWYGVPSVIPYIIMVMMAVEKSWRFANTGLKYSAIPFYSITSFVIMSMADNVEQPFVWLPWIACYLMMAPILIMPVEEIEALKKDNTDICAKEPEQI